MIKTKQKTYTFDMIRHRTPTAIAALKVDLGEQKWNEVFVTEDPSNAYDAFLSILISSYSMRNSFLEWKSPENASVQISHGSQRE